MESGRSCGAAALPVLLLLAAPLGRVSTAAVNGATIADRDARLEIALLKGKVERMETLDVGTTLPQRVWIRHGELELSAAFKTVDISRHGISRLQDRSTEVNFSDRYQYERAAYLLARELGLEIVPVAVERKIRNRTGALVHWVEDSFSEAERAAQRLVPPDVDRWQRQLGVMRAFDALILNVDRNPGNILYTRRDWRVHLIDHSRSFRNDDRLTEEFTSHPARIDRRLLERLGELERDGLRKLLKGQVTKRQIDHLLARRKLVLEKIERDRANFGDEVVLFDD